MPCSSCCICSLNPKLQPGLTNLIALECSERIQAFKELEVLLISRMVTAGQDSVFIDDAIRIQKYYEELQGTSVIGFLNISTSGSVVVRINGNREGNGHSHMTLLYFASQLASFYPSAKLAVCAARLAACTRWLSFSMLKSTSGGMKAIFPFYMR